VNLKTTATISRAPKAWSCVLAMILASAMQLIAHGGFDHVTGTVVKVENNVVTVKTTKGNVDVRLNEKTEITRGDHKADIADLKPGTRVVIDIPEGSKDKIAHSVKVGVSTPAATAAHGAHKQ
jgi:hypothetical protein